MLKKRITYTLEQWRGWEHWLCTLHGAQKWACSHWCRFQITSPHPQHHQHWLVVLFSCWTFLCGFYKIIIIINKDWWFADRSQAVMWRSCASLTNNFRIPKKFKLWFSPFPKFSKNRKLTNSKNQISSSYASRALHYHRYFGDPWMFMGSIGPICLKETLQQ